jgi:hypothetical protein
LATENRTLDVENILYISILIPIWDISRQRISVRQNRGWQGIGSGIWQSAEILLHRNNMTIW